MRLLLPTTAAILTALALFAAAPGSGRSTGSADAVTHAPLACLDSGSVAAIRRRPQAIADVYAHCRDEFVGALGSGFAGVDEPALELAFAGVVAYQMAPYGQFTPLDLPSLLRAPQLDCDNYVALAFQLAAYLGRPASGVRFVGWDGGAVGNHAQLFVASGPDDGLLIDPTIDVVARTTFDQVASGMPVPADRIVNFSTRTILRDYRPLILDALTEGLYRPSDLLYYYDDFTRFAVGIEGPYDTWMTPGATALRRELSLSRRAQ